MKKTKVGSLPQITSIATLGMLVLTFFVSLTTVLGNTSFEDYFDYFEQLGDGFFTFLFALAVLIISVVAIILYITELARLKKYRGVCNGNDLPSSFFSKQSVFFILFVGISFVMFIITCVFNGIRIDDMRTYAAAQYKTLAFYSGMANIVFIAILTLTAILNKLSAKAVTENGRLQSQGLIPAAGCACCKKTRRSILAVLAASSLILLFFVFFKLNDAFSNVYTLNLLAEAEQPAVAALAWASLLVSLMTALLLCAAMCYSLVALKSVSSEKPEELSDKTKAGAATALFFAGAAFVMLAATQLIALFGNEMLKSFLNQMLMEELPTEIAMLLSGSGDAFFNSIALFVLLAIAAIATIACTIKIGGTINAGAQQPTMPYGMPNAPYGNAGFGGNAPFGAQAPGMPATDASAVKGVPADKAEVEFEVKD